MPDVSDGAFVFVATRSNRGLGIRAGDRVVVRPGHAEGVTILRTLPPNYGRILALFEDGHLSLPPGGDREETLDVLRELAAASPPPLHVVR